MTEYIFASCATCALQDDCNMTDWMDDRDCPDYIPEEIEEEDDSE